MRVATGFLLLVAAVAPAAASSPAISAHLAGELTQALIPGAPPLQWSADLAAQTDGSMHAMFSGEGQGTRVHLEIGRDATGRNLTWKLTDATVTLEQWKGAISRLSKTLASGLAFTGDATISGQGDFRYGVPAGEVTLVIHDATIRDAAQGWSLAGISVTGSFGFEMSPFTLRSTSPLTIAVQTITTKRFGARNLLVQGRLENRAKLQLTNGRVEVAGGDMIASPFVVDLNPFHVSADVTINRIGLEDVVALVPTAVQAAHGRVDGMARIEWDGESDPKLISGHLVLRSDSPADVTLWPTPGLFTGRLPGWLSWVAPAVSRTLSRAELGHVPIAAHSLDVTFSHQADVEGRTAVVHLMGEPQDPKTHIPLDIETNVHGPLEAVVQFVMTNNVSVGLH